MQQYVLAGGDAAAERLALLSRVMWPTSRALLMRAGFLEGIDVLDVGCGSGDVSCELARWTTHAGSVTGVDRDESVLAHARQLAESQRAKATFMCQDITELKLAPFFDLVYSRFLLAHLSDPGDAVRRMAACVRPGGTLVVEDVDFPGSFCYPACPAYDRYVELYQAVVRHHGGNAAIGPRLLELFREAGVLDIQLQVVLPTFHTGEGKQVSPLTMEHIRKAVVAAGLADDDEVTRVVRELNEFAADEGNIIGLPRIFQLHGRVGETAS